MRGPGNGRFRSGRTRRSPARRARFRIPVIDKRTSDAVAGTGLTSLLADAREVVIARMQSEYCVRETTLAALERGLAVVLARGAHATYGGGERTAAETAAAVEALPRTFTGKLIRTRLGKRDG